METADKIIATDYSGLSVLGNFKDAHKLIVGGMETEAKNNFPLEFYLLKKYMDRNLDDFIGQLKMRMRLVGER